MKTLHFADPSPGATGYGWAVCNHNLHNALAAHFYLTPADPDVVFMPVDSAFRPLSPARGKINVCLNFFESPLEPCARENAENFDLCFVGSTWCQDRCAAAGIHNTAVLIQGVDSAIFSQQPPRKPDGQFRIFSGGKFEYRKGQDLVIRAFSEFAKTHPEAHLVCAWFQPWGNLISSMAQSPHLRWCAGRFPTHESFFAELLVENGVSRDRFTILPGLSQADLAREMAKTDCGLFPNRCEGGTNLVLMEYRTLQRSVIANCRTGHSDIADFITYVIDAEADEAGWAKQTPEEIILNIETAIAFNGLGPLAALPAWTWAAAAARVADEVDRISAMR